MEFDKISEKLNGIKGLILSVAGVLGLSFVLHSWMSENFVTKEHFDLTVQQHIKQNMNTQFLVLKKSIDETEYNVLGYQVATIKIDDTIVLDPLVLDSYRKVIRKHCVLGIKLGYMTKDTDCETVVKNKLLNK